MARALACLWELCLLACHLWTLGTVGPVAGGWRGRCAVLSSTHSLFCGL